MADEVQGGAGFLMEPAGSRRVFTPDQFSEEQRMFYEAAREFMAREILPENERIESMEPGLMPELIRKAGTQGLLAIDIPEKYGGLGLDKATSALVGEAIAIQGSFAVASGVQMGIGTLPILIFGSDDQKERYLPALASGEKISAYCLTEPGSGSDALSAKTTAVKDGDHFVLNGVKQWISNAGFADVYIVFAQLEGRFTGFIVDAELPGVSTGAEEKKMGLKGSSTRQVILEDVRVPAANLLGDPGKGAVIAFNILNIGRYKLGIASIGVAKEAMDHALRYAGDRRQFKTRLVDFPAIREKFANMAAQIYATEAMGWRLVGMLDDRIEALEKDDPAHWQQAVRVIKDYAIECSILKVFGSEMVGDVLDEALQIHGGYGFTSEYPIEQPYRDTRVNRIFEGTNEINRMLIPGTIFKRVMQGKLNFLPVAGKVEAEVKTGEAAEPPFEDETPLALERFMCEQAKKVFFFTSGAAAQKHMADMDRQQELLLALADMVIDVWTADSTLARVAQYTDAHGAEASSAQLAIGRVVVTECYRRIAGRAKDLAGFLARRPTKMCAGIDRLAPYVPVDLVHARREVAERLCEAGRYRF